MPQSLARILVHMIWSTKNREPTLTRSLREELYLYLAETLESLDCPVLQIGGVDDHVHLLFGLSRILSAARVAEVLKTSSSKWIKTKGNEHIGFYWQAGYGAFSVSQSDADAVIRYIQRQEQHHRRTSFQEEYRGFLTRYRVAFDERYVWD